MLAKAPKYDHRTHAGNAGDVWKHFILAETADYLLIERKELTYAESHVGYPEYSLKSVGEWEGGIGRCWSRISELAAFRYFRTIRDANPQELTRYPGSADLVFEIARMHRSVIDAEVWDIDPNVASAWREDPGTGIRFHPEDGFKGVLSFLDRSLPGLILIDPPYLDRNDMRKALNLLRSAVEAGWIVLWWQMRGNETAPQAGLRKYTIRFNDVDLVCGRWQGATMAVGGADARLAGRLDSQVERFLNLAKVEKSF